jgi:hypothetical protein
LFTRDTHLRVWLDGENGVPIVEQQASENASAGRDVCDYMIRLKATLVVQKFNNFGGICRPITHVVVNASREASGGIGSWHVVLSTIVTGVCAALAA